jgi:hypothetical protein
MTASGNAETTRSGLSRRRVLRYGVATGAAAAVGSTFSSFNQPASASASGPAEVLPTPKPIPGGLALPDGVIHVFPPGPPEVTLPFTGLTLQGLDVEPSVITDYSGFTALAFHAGSATGNDGTRYNLETDMRVMSGRYVAADGSRKRGVFAFV